MKSVPMWLLAAAPYGLLGVVLCAGENNTILRLSLALYAAVLAGNVACALALPRCGYAPEKLLLCSAALKLCHVPAYLIACAGALLTGVLSLPLLPLLLLWGYTLLLMTSLYGLGGLLGCHRAGRLSTKALVPLVAALFFFCFDVVGAVGGCCWVRKNRGEVR